MDQCRLAGVERAYGTESMESEAEIPELKGGRVKWEGGRHNTTPQIPSLCYRESCTIGGLEV